MCEVKHHNSLLGFFSIRHNIFLPHLVVVTEMLEYNRFLFTASKSLRLISLS